MSKKEKIKQLRHAGALFETDSDHPQGFCWTAFGFIVLRVLNDRANLEIDIPVCQVLWLDDFEIENFNIKDLDKNLNVIKCLNLPK